MRIDLVDGAAEWRGVVWLSIDADGVSPRRVEARYLAQVGELTAQRVNAASGVRLALATDAPLVELSCRLAGLHPGEPLRPPVADLVIDDELVATEAPSERSAVASTPGVERCVFRFRVPAHDTARQHGSPPTIELWLPQDAVVTVESVEVPDGFVVAAPAADRRPRWVHHGSSISHGAEARSPARTWPATVARRVGLHLTNLGFAAECQLDQFAARSIGALPADVITLELGVNVVNGATMVERTFVSALHGFLDTVRDGHPATPIVVVSPVVFPCAEQRPGPTAYRRGGRIVAIGRRRSLAAGALSIVRVRELIEHVVESRAAAGDGRLRYLDGLRLFGHGDVTMLADGLHPDANGHDLIAARFASAVFGAAGLFPDLSTMTRR